VIGGLSGAGRIRNRGAKIFAAVGSTQPLLSQRRCLALCPGFENTLDSPSSAESKVLPRNLLRLGTYSEAVVGVASLPRSLSTGPRYSSHIAAC
jgi:hypothetical protein